MNFPVVCQTLQQQQYKIGTRSMPSSPANDSALRGKLRLRCPASQLKMCKCWNCWCTMDIAAVQLLTSDTKALLSLMRSAIVASLCFIMSSHSCVCDHFRLIHNSQILSQASRACKNK